MPFFSRLKALLNQWVNQGYSWPALDVVLPGGRYLHLVGSIHMGTPNMAPLPARLIRKLHSCDALIVEADILTGDSPFNNVPWCDPLESRLSAEQLAEVEQVANEAGVAMRQLDALPFWQIALVLQAHQAQRLGLRPEYGIDWQLLNAAQQSGRKILELEGSDQQIALLNTLPDDGLPLLLDTLTHWRTNAHLLQVMISWWLQTPPASGNTSLPNTFGDQLYDVLMNQRNITWNAYLQQLPPGRYVVAVGALHLYGSGNLPELLQAKKNGQ
ncbi:conjugal transfer protein TraB [Mangrovibacter phragmitis]|uniref:Conjugal transfer protein TraB n=1 Tax=Mangrovibacter phragmitis TaxID=1691903 RepID=A0A1B7L104_9ENTR|nr:TraB/GumN family protein [Mangrovibacter phragmitis]OAT76069.1 conjugal transfer protein TraB [Mangrovibacter phragmitis]